MGHTICCDEDFMGRIIFVTNSLCNTTSVVMKTLLDNPFGDEDNIRHTISYVEDLMGHTISCDEDIIRHNIPCDEYIMIHTVCYDEDIFGHPICCD